MDSIQHNLHAYRLIFILENNLRKFVKQILEENFGQNWKNEIKNSILKRCEEQKDKTIRYLSAEMLDKDNILNFSYLSDIRKIIEEKWDFFYPTFRDVDKFNIERCKKTVNNKLLEIEFIRNFINHNNPSNENLVNILKANFHFFETYIPNFDKEIFSVVSYNEFLITQESIKNIIKKIKQKEHVPLELIEKANLNEQLNKLVVQYNKIPKTRDKLKDNDLFIKTNKLIEQLNFLMV